MTHFNIILMSTLDLHNTVAISLNSVFPLYFVVNILMRFDVFTPASANSVLVRCDVT